MRRASLIYLVGASGSGKDTLIRYARERLGPTFAVAFAHRYITRDANAGGENHVALSAAEFALRRDAGLFALHWESHGHAYGIGIEIDQWLASGITAVVNGSRAYLPEAQKRYPDLHPVWIEVSPDVLRGRLQARGREDAQAIEARLDRLREMPLQDHAGLTIRNDGDPAIAGDALIAFLLQHTKDTGCA